MHGQAEKRAAALLTPILGESRARNLAPLGHVGADAALRGGLMRGALHEVFARDSAGFGFAAGLMHRAAGPKRMLWIVQDYAALEHGQLSATGLKEIGLDPMRMLLLRAANATDALKAGADALSCGALGAVLIEVPGNPKILDLTCSRRLLLAAQAKGVTALLLRSDAQAAPSAAQTRWQIRSAPSPEADDFGQPRFDAELVRNRLGETGRWMMEWCCDDGAFAEASEGTAYPGVVAAPASHRPPYSPPQRLAG
jgi:protein ImuA